MLFAECFTTLFRDLTRTPIRNSVAVELCSNGLISTEVKNEATRISGDPVQKAFAVVDELFTQVNSSPEILLKVARVLSQNPEVNQTAFMMDTIFWRAFMSHQLSGTPPVVVWMGDDVHVS